MSAVHNYYHYIINTTTTTDNIVMSLIIMLNITTDAEMYYIYTNILHELLLFCVIFLLFHCF